MVSNLLMPLLGNFLKGQHPIIAIFIQMSVVIGLVGTIVIRNWKLKVDASGYDIFRAVLDPPGTVVDLPVRRDWKRGTRQNTRSPWLNVTTINFADDMKIEPYGKQIRTAHITHFGSLTNRLESTYQENVQYKGDEVEHNTVYIMTLWPNEMYPVSQEKSRPEPNWILINASKADQSDERIKTRTLAMALGLDQQFLGLLHNQPKTVKSYIQRVQLENERLLRKNIELQQYLPPLIESVEHWKISDTTKDGMLESDKQEITGMIGDQLNLKKAAERRLEQKISNINDVFQLLKASNWLSKLDIKWLAVGAIGILFILYLWLNPKIIQGITKSLTPATMIISVVLVAIIAYVAIWLTKTIRGQGKTL